jgi:hypothetical protein
MTRPTSVINPITLKPFRSAKRPLAPVNRESSRYRAAATALFRAGANESGVEPTPFAYRLVESYPFADLLDAYVGQCAAGLPTCDGAARVLHRLVEEFVSPEDVVFALARLGVDWPERAADAAKEVVVPFPDLSLLLIETDTLGLLRRDVFETIFTGHHIDYSSYLVYRLRHVTPKLTDAQRDFARTIASDWDGTLATLLETVRELRQKELSVPLTV